MSASSLLKSLSDEQRVILDVKTVKLHRTAGELLALLKPIAAFDTAAAPARRTAGCWLAVLIVVAVLGFLYAFGQYGSAQMIAFAGVAAIVVIAVIVGRSYRTLKAADISDNLATVVIPFLAILREDVPAAEPIAVNIDLSAADVKSKLVRTMEPQKKGYPKLVTKFYANPWFDGSAVFADGTRVAWDVADRLRVTTKTKRNPRGKIKTKSKSKLRSDVQVKLGFPTKRFAPVHGHDAANAKRHEVRIAKQSKGVTDTSHAFQLLIDAIAEGYRSVQGNKGGAR